MRKLYSVVCIIMTLIWLFSIITITLFCLKHASSFLKITKCNKSSSSWCAGHPWVQAEGVAPDEPLDSAVLGRLKQFSAMNKLKKMAIRVSAHQLPWKSWNNFIHFLWCCSICACGIFLAFLRNHRITSQFNYLRSRHDILLLKYTFLEKFYWNCLFKWSMLVWLLEVLSFEE